MSRSANETPKSPLCPICAKPLEAVRYNPDSMLNEDQFASVRAGDWVCSTCPDNGRGWSGLCYWWSHELNLFNTSQTASDILKLYSELLFAVESKFPGESRHQTALRYIKEAESCSNRSGTYERDPRSICTVSPKGDPPESCGPQTPQKS